MKISITSWMTGAVLFEGDFSCIADAVKAAISKNANLRYADLSNADLRYADLRYADLRYANLRYADLRYADLRYADLRNADLRNADLRYADLSYANLSYANLSYADLSYANLSYADLSYANLSKIFNALPELENPDALILAAIEKGGKLEMGDWHRCETTHCRAGWYIHHAGPAGAMLEATYGPSAAGAIIFAKAYPKCKVPNFHASNDEALEDIRKNAEAHAKK